MHTGSFDNILIDFSFVLRQVSYNCTILNFLLVCRRNQSILKHYEMKIINAFLVIYIPWHLSLKVLKLYILAPNLLIWKRQETRNVTIIWNKRLRHEKMRIRYFIISFSRRFASRTKLYQKVYMWGQIIVLEIFQWNFVTTGTRKTWIITCDYPIS